MLLTMPAATPPQVSVEPGGSSSGHSGRHPLASTACWRLGLGRRAPRPPGGAGCGPVFASVRAAGPSGLPCLALCTGWGRCSRGWKTAGRSVLPYVCGGAPACAGALAGGAHF